MKYPEICILGAGFAGLAVIHELKYLINKGMKVKLFDKNHYTTMMPVLPDVAGGRISAKYLIKNISDLIQEQAQFHHEKVKAVDLNRRIVMTDQKIHHYDILVITIGSTCEFYGFDQHLTSLYTLDSLAAAEKLQHSFQEYINTRKKPLAAIAGGGYTGLELACNLRRLTNSEKQGAEICIIEAKETILPGLPEEVRSYMRRQCQDKNIQLITNNSIKEFDGNNITLSDGQRLNDVHLSWTTGTKLALPDLHGNQQQIKDKRIIVDTCLRIPQHQEVYAAGDSAAIKQNSNYLRKSVNYAIYSGRQAGRNIVKMIDHSSLKPFVPFDPGWVIPFCDTGIGNLPLVGMLKGRLPLALHYFMCGFRNYDIRNRTEFAKMAIKTLTG